MKNIGLTFVISAVLSQSSFAATSDLRDKYASWIKSNIIGRTLISGSHRYSDNGRLYYESSNKVTYGGLTLTERGLKFNTVVVAVQENFDVVDGQIIRPGRNASRVIHSECEFGAKHYDSDRLIGFCRPISITGFDPTGTSSLAIFEIVSDQLVLSTKSAIPSECFAAGGTYYGCQTESKETFSLIDGKLKSIALKTYRRVEGSDWRVVDTTGPEEIISTEGK